MAQRDRLGVEARRRLGERVRYLRGDRTIEELADTAQLSSGSLSQLERGRSDPTLGTLLRSMQALNLTSIEELLGEPPEYPSARLARPIGSSEPPPVA
jgi:transcriptional regulator with XRE-family HTH domain